MPQEDLESRTGRRPNTYKPPKLLKCTLQESTCRISNVGDFK